MNHYKQRSGAIDDLHPLGGKVRPQIVVALFIVQELLEIHRTVAGNGGAGAESIVSGGADEVFLV